MSTVPTRQIKPSRTRFYLGALALLIILCACVFLLMPKGSQNPVAVAFSPTAAHTSTTIPSIPISVDAVMEHFLSQGFACSPMQAAGAFSVSECRPTNDGAPGMHAAIYADNGAVYWVVIGIIPTDPAAGLPDGDAEKFTSAASLPIPDFPITDWLSQSLPLLMDTPSLQETLGTTPVHIFRVPENGAVVLHVGYPD